MTENRFLYHRFMNQGTLSDPKGIPDPEYSLPGTLHWMHALAILVNEEKIDASSMKTLYASIDNGNRSDQEINTSFEQLLMSLHHLASLKAMGLLSKRIDTARSAIVTWYYGIFHAASAMIAAQVGSFQNNHAGTANSWDSQFSARNLVPTPFSYRLTTLVKKDVEEQIKCLRETNLFDLKNQPKNPNEAIGACITYLQGSANWRREHIEQDVKRENKLINFRTKKAQQIRDARLADKCFGFVHQAYRYRGKANYREALFISYGNHIELSLIDFYSDLSGVLEGFLCMAGAFCARRIGKELWNIFQDDIESNVQLIIKP